MTLCIGLRVFQYDPSSSRILIVWSWRGAERAFLSGRRPVDTALDLFMSGPGEAAGQGQRSDPRFDLNRVVETWNEARDDERKAMMRFRKYLFSNATH